MVAADQAVNKVKSVVQCSRQHTSVREGRQGSRQVGGVATPHGRAARRNLLQPVNASHPADRDAMLRHHRGCDAVCAATCFCCAAAISVCRLLGRLLSSHACTWLWAAPLAAILRARRMPCRGHQEQQRDWRGLGVHSQGRTQRVECSRAPRQPSRGPARRCGSVFACWRQTEGRQASQI